MRTAVIVAAVSAAVLAGCKAQQENVSSADSERSLVASQPANSARDDTMRGLRVGDRVPDATLATPDGRAYRLSEVVGSRPVVVTFYRGGWCPYCAGALTEWRGRLDEVRALGAELIAITPESPDRAVETVSEHDLGFTVLSDVEGEAAAAFDLGFALDASTQRRYRGFGVNLPDINAMGDWNLVIPATYVVDTEGVIRYAYVNENYKDRADPDEVLAVLRSLR